jgi:hypothetical protein
MALLYQCKARPADGLVLAKGAAAGAGEAVPLFKDKTAVFADRGDELKTPPGSRGPGQVGQMVQHLSFGKGQQLRQLQAGARLLR